MLSDKMIRYYMTDDQALVIDPAPEESQIQPASVDLRLGREFVRYTNPLVHPGVVPVCVVPPPENHLARSYDETLVLPGEFVLATTLEHVTIPPTLAARVEGRSSFGRMGLMVHATAGFIDPGFSGNITLELYNLNTRAVLLKAGMRICQISLYKVDGKVGRPYGSGSLGSKYQGQTGTTLPKPVK
jgi:dCTP deaminase